VKKILIAVAVIVVAVGGFVGFKYMQLQQLAAKYKDAKEIASATITKDRSVWTMKIDSVFAAPIEAVWNAMQHPEHSQKHVPDVFRKSEIVKEEGNTKTVELEVQVLGLPSQSMTAHVTYNPGGRSMSVVTEKGLQDLNVTYTLTALAPDRTLLTYAGTAEEKVSIPLPSQSIIEGALRELFIAQVHAIQKEMAEKAG
jgi:hypothetical protein